jgi:serine/threonine protein kinase
VGIPEGRGFGHRWRTAVLLMPWFPGSLQGEVDDRRYVENLDGGISRLVDLVDRLALLHGKGIAHCDLKPANVLVDARNELLLADLGLAIWVLSPEFGRHTDTGEAVGSRYYIAPEYENGRYEGTEHRPADFYAFGKIVWVLLTGRPQPRSREACESRFPGSNCAGEFEPSIAH